MKGAVNPRKGAGPGRLSRKLLKECADQLAEVFTKIFDRPVALLLVIMKYFEKLVWTHIISSLPSTFDTHYFAYRANRSTEDTSICVWIKGFLSDR